MLNIVQLHMPSQRSDPPEDLLEYIWSLARLSYSAQAALWRREGEALAQGDAETAERLRDYQIAFYSSAIQIHAVEMAVRKLESPDDTFFDALRRADENMRAALVQLDAVATACDGAEAFISTLHELENLSNTV